MRVNTTSLAKYTLLPGILPRIKYLIGSGFAFLAGLIAIIYSNVGLLPPHHTYLDPKNFGRFGIRHVIAEAGRGLVFKRENRDKIIIYFLILGGIVVLTLQFVLLGFSFFSSSAFAGSLWYDYFVTTSVGPSQDMAFVILDKVFGVMQFSGTNSAIGFFDSCISDLSTPCRDIQGQVINSPTSFPTPMHLALHQMLGFYSLGIAFISFAVLLYFVVAIVGETITSGTPFGKRMNKAWFIPRLIVFFLLIAPISYSGNNAGINVGQLVTLYAAKYGSNMATNAWLTFVDSGASANAAAGQSVTSLMSVNQRIIARPNAPEIGGLTQFMHLVRMCIFAQKIVHGIDVLPYIVREPSSDSTTIVPSLTGGTGYPYDRAFNVSDDYLDYFINSGFTVRPFHEAAEFSRYRDVILRFGHRDPPLGNPLNLNNPPESHDQDWGYVDPTCGELRFEMTSLDEFVVGPSPSAIFPIQDNYFYFIGVYLAGGKPTLDVTTYCMLQAIMPHGHDGSCVDDSYAAAGGGLGFDFSSDTKWLTAEAARASIEYFNAANKLLLSGEDVDWNSYNYNPSIDMFADAAVNSNGVNAFTENAAYSGNALMSPEIRERGWAGAALWYNQIAELNGIFASAVQNVPRPHRYPKVMETVADAHRAVDTNMSYIERFNPRLANGQKVDFEKEGDQYIASALYSAFEFWNRASVQETIVTRASGNAIVDTINMIIGSNGLYDIMENDGVFPLALISGLGKSMVDASLRNLFVGIVGQGVGELLSDDFIGNLARVASKFSFRFGMIGLSIGFILYYVVPILPFLYFFFAFSGWVKSIFEAIVAMPLWALAHIKIDGEGLPGPWATNGYFLLFEIFVRPTLIIFGFIFSIGLFSALVNELHRSYHLLTLVATGYDLEATLFASDGAGANVAQTLPNGSGQQRIDMMRGPVDELFYTIMYTIIVYMIAISCFKLVDQIPNNILRWMGMTVSTFHESIGDPATELTGKLYRGTQTTNAQLIQMIEGAQSNTLTNTQLALGK